MFGCSWWSSCLSKAISRRVVMGTPSCAKGTLIFFIATNLPWLSRSRALYTVPYAPLKPNTITWLMSTIELTKYKINNKVGSVGHVDLTVSDLIEFFVVFLLLHHGRHSQRKLHSGQWRHHCDGRRKRFQTQRSTTIWTRSPRMIFQCEGFTTKRPWHGSRKKSLWTNTCGR